MGMEEEIDFAPKAHEYSEEISGAGREVQGVPDAQRKQVGKCPKGLSSVGLITHN